MSSRVRPPALLPTRGYSGFSDGGTTPHSVNRGETTKGSHLRRSSFGATSPGPDASALPWSLVPDMFHARYYPPLSHTEMDWHPLDSMHLSLDARVDFQEALRPSRPAGASRRAAEAASLAAGVEAWQSAAVSAGESGGTRPPRQQLLFQYKPYAQQEALDMGAPAVSAVVEAVLGPAAAGAAPQAGAFASLPPETLWDPAEGGAAWGVAAGASTGEVAAAILVKLIMDNYLAAGARAAYAPSLFLLQTALTSGTPAQQARVFDLLFNLSLHGELLFQSPLADGPAADLAPPELGGEEAEWQRTVNRALRSAAYATSDPTLPGAPPSSAAAGAAGAAPPLSGSHGRARRGSRSQGAGEEGAEPEPWPLPPGSRPPGTGADARSDSFQHWLRLLLFRLLLRLSSLEGVSESVWVAALCTLTHFSVHDGRTVRALVEELPLSVVAALLDRAREWRWAPTVVEWLVTLACNLCYSRGEGAAGAGSRSLKSPSATESLRSSTNRRRTGHSQPASELWWPSAHLDVDRVLDFGGMRQLLRCYREAATHQAQNNVFCVLYDYITTPQGQHEYDPLAPWLGQSAHSSEVVALGAALLHLRAAQALRPLFLAGTPGAMPTLADELATQMAAVQAVNPGRVIAVPPAFVGELLGCLEDLACHASQVPRALEERLRRSLEVVAAEEAPENAAAAMREDAFIWDALVDCLRDQSELGGEIARGWLLQLLLTSAERELQRSTLGAPPALLPEVTPHGCQLAPGQRGITSQDRLRDLLEQALATTGDARAADAFIDAVQARRMGLLVHARLRAVRASTGPAGPLSGLEAPVTRLHALPKSAPLRASGTGPLLFGEPQDERYGSAASVSGSAAGAVSDSLGREDAGSISAGSSEGSDLTTDSVDVAQLGASEPVGSWAAAAAPGVLLGTLGLAVEWLLQAPKEARRGAVLRAAQLLVAFVVQRPRPGGAAGEGGPADGRRRGVPAASSASHRWAGGALGTLGEERSVTEQLSDAPAQAPATSALTATSAASSAAASTEGGAAASGPRPAPSPGAGPASAPAGAAPGARAPALRRRSLLTLDPPLSVPGLTPTAPSTTARVLGLLRAGKPEQAGALLAPGARARLESERAAATGAALAAALAERDASSVMDAFLRGEGVVSCAHLLHLPPLLLRALFDDLRPEQAPAPLGAGGFGALSPRNGAAGAAPHAGAAHAGAAEARAARRVARAADAALGSKAAVLAERPLRDARAATLLLLMSRCMAAPSDLAAVGGPAFFAGLLQEADPRIRRAASVFVLRHLMAARRDEYRAALRHVVARAQQANEEALVTDPYQQVKTLLDMQLIDLGAAAGGQGGQGGRAGAVPPAAAAFE